MKRSAAATTSLLLLAGSTRVTSFVPSSVGRHYSPVTAGTTSIAAELSSSASSQPGIRGCSAMGITRRRAKYKSRKDVSEVVSSRKPAFHYTR